ncbi:DNA translocase FtsK [Desulfospira joergensenii]|uniref:DNA translocase FtsK n=1 Tax=Desulfospira joergensenii TaxID=53329 RepID=UPI0003B6F122|nr:DNA translocase FtsK 4TM domain-containing protein [Desulfospira joergensenii]
MKKELIGILLFFLIVLSALSLFSYDASDPCVGNGFFQVPDNTHNYFGLIGAHVAGLFVYLFGIGAFWMPVILALSSIWYLKARTPKIIWLTLGGGLILMVCTGAMFFLFKDAYSFSGTLVPAGGILGTHFTSFLLKYANIAGCIIILVFFMVIGFVLATGISMVALAGFIREKAFELAATIKEDFQEAKEFLAQALADWKEKREEAKQEREEIQITPGLPEPEDEPEEKPPVQIPERALSFDKEDKPSGNAVQKDLFEPHIVPLEEDEREYVSETLIEDIREQEDFKLPSISFLDEKVKVKKDIDTRLLQEKARILEEKLKDFNVSGEVVEILPGPVITTFEYKPAPGVKLSKITGLSDDLALALSAISIRIVAPIPGRDVVGIEIPNDERELVNLREMVSARDFVTSDSLLTLGLGKDLMGRPVATKMDKMPHLLIAGATGTGKSVGLNSMIISLLYKATPDQVKLIMIDPKRIELSVYNDIPHLISPVVTDMKKATNALFWAVREMERRYELLEMSGLRNLVQYNDKVREELKKKAGNPEPSGETAFQESMEVLPYIVVIVDELSDLMMVASKDVEFALTRLAQMARAAGIHLILATQRPSADVLTGTIKANFPTRISFQVSSKIDGRIIIDQGGAESLLGNGDMLFCPPGTGKLMRIQGAYISETEIARVTSFLKEQRKPDYNEEITMGDEEGETKEFDEADYDEKYDEAVAVVTQSGQASISYVQRRLRIGYNRAARLIEIMEHEGIVGPQIGSKPREILVKSYDENN